MKFILPILCSILFIGCSNSSQTSDPVAEDTKIAKPLNAEASANAETSIPSPVTLPAVPLKADITAPAAVIIPQKPVTAVKEKEAVKITVDGKAIYTQKCVSCHGAKAEKSALNKSQTIADFSEVQVKDALEGYKAGTYGKEMKGIMQGQVKTLDDTQIEALAHYISTL